MKINITEEEKRNILKMHKSLISEQSQVSKVGATNSGGANKQYCTNMEKQMEKEYNGVGVGIKIENLTFTQPNPTNSNFGTITFDRSYINKELGKNTEGKYEKITLTCGSQNTVGKATRYNYQYKSYQDWKANSYNDGIYAQYCSRINTCAGFVA